MIAVKSSPAQTSGRKATVLPFGKHSSRAVLAASRMESSTSSLNPRKRAQASSIASGSAAISPAVRRPRSFTSIWITATYESESFSSDSGSPSEVNRRRSFGHSRSCQSGAGGVSRTRRVSSAASAYSRFRAASAGTHSFLRFPSRLQARRVHGWPVRECLSVTEGARGQRRGWILSGEPEGSFHLAHCCSQGIAYRDERLSHIQPRGPKRPATSGHHAASSWATSLFESRI